MPEPLPPESYDEAYFERWYRHEGFGSPELLRQKVAYAVSVTEYLTDRPVRSVLDLGCGEGAWQVALADIRPDARYLGIDPSSYAIERYGEARNLRLGDFGHLDQVIGDDEGPFDLIVCVDVLGYTPHDQVLAGLTFLAEVLSGLALVEVFTAEDEFDGDIEHYQRRSRSQYRRWTNKAGLHRVGPNLFAGELVVPTLSTLEAPLG